LPAWKQRRLEKEAAEAKKKSRKKATERPNYMPSLLPQSEESIQMCTSPSDKTISPATLKEKAPVTQDILPKQLDEQELAVKVEPKIIVTEAPQQKEELDQLKSLEPAEKSTDKISNGKESKSQSHIKQEQNPKSDVPKSKEATIKELTQDPIEIEAPANQTKVCKSTPTNDVETPNQLVNVSNKPDVSLPPAPGKKPSEAEQPKIEEQKIQQEPSKPEIQAI